MNFRSTFLFSVIWIAFLLPNAILSQNFADKSYYLVDSLNMEELSSQDKELVEKALKSFHSSSDDTSKIKSLVDICENMMHASWEKYQFKQYELISEALAKDIEREEMQKLLSFLGNALNNIGYIHMNKGEIELALDYFHKSLTIQEKVNDKKGMTNTLNNIGVIYGDQGEIQLALEYHQKSLKLREEAKDKWGMANSLNNIGYLYEQEGNLSLAIIHYEKSLAINQEIKELPGVANALNNIGSIYERQNQSKKALDYFLQSLEIDKEIADKAAMAACLNNIGSIYNQLGESKKAQKFAERSLKISNELGYPENIKNASELISKIAYKQGDYKRSLLMYRQYILMRDSIKNEETQKATVRQQIKYKYDKKALADSLAHAQESEIKDAKLAKQEAQISIKQNQQKWLFGGLALVLIFAVFMYNRFRVTHRQKLIIEEQKHLVEEKNNEILDSIQYAKRIQSAILPPISSIKKSFSQMWESQSDFFIYYKPKDIVAGDFYWMEQVEVNGKEDNAILFAAADCTGHGVPGAMVSVMCSSALTKAVKEQSIHEPAKILDKTVDLLEQQFAKSEEEVKDGMDVALVSLQSTEDEIKLQYAGANNPLWIVRKSAQPEVKLSYGEIRSLKIESSDYTLYEIKADKQPIGHYPNRKPYHNYELNLIKGDSLYLFSDGFSDQFGGEKGKKFKSGSFKKLLLTIQDKNMNEQHEYLENTFENWKGNLEQLDDVCVIGVRI